MNSWANSTTMDSMTDHGEGIEKRSATKTPEPVAREGDTESPPAAVSPNVPATSPTFAAFDTAERLGQLKRMRSVDRIASIGRILVSLPFEAELRSILLDLRRLRTPGAKPGHVLLTGESGTGKTTMIEHYISENPRRDGGERWIIPCFRAAMPDSPTRENLVRELLSSLGDQMSNRGSVDDQTKRLHRYIKECSVEVICIDDVHRLIDRDKRLTTAAEWLASFAEDSSAILLLAGWPQTLKVVDTHKNLQGLIRHRIEAGLLSFRRQNGRPGIREFLEAVEHRLPLAQASGLWTDDKETAARIFYATDGCVRDVMQLLTVATAIAVNRSFKKLDLGILSAAWKQSLARRKPHKVNVFDLKDFTDYEIRMLSRDLRAATRTSFNETNVSKLSRRNQ